MKMSKTLSATAVAMLLAGCAAKEYQNTFSVTSSVETEPVSSKGDAADDPAIWLHPTDPSMSLVIGTNKQFGLDVYDLNGRLLARHEDGRLNNVDVRGDIAAAEHRGANVVVVYRVDPESRMLRRVEADIPTIPVDVYGSTLYKGKDGELYSFIGSKEGTVIQLLHSANDDGYITQRIVRELTVPSQVEGMVADDAAGVLFIGEEKGGVWKFPADPAGGTEGEMIHSIAEDGPIWKPDIEGLTIYELNETEGYLIVSSQGANRYVVLDRQPPHDYIATIRIVGNGIDGAEETDGIAVSSDSFGSEFPGGLLAVQDGKNSGGTQNYKFVGWDEIVQASGGLLERR